MDNKVSPIPNNDEMTIETISVDNEGNINPISFEYNEYRSELNKIYKLTNEINTIVSTYTVEGDKCHHIMIVKYNNGMKSTEKDFIFDYTDSFKNDFIVPMLEDFCKYNSVKKEEIISENNELILNVTTVDNDVLIIKNIDSIFAKQLENIIYKNNQNNEYFINNSKVINNSGNSNAAIIVLMIVLIIILVLGYIYFFFKR